MKKSNTFLELLKLLGSCLAGCFLWLIIFSIALEPDADGATSEPFPGAICVLGVLTALIVMFILNYNRIQNAYQKTKSSFSNIGIFKERSERLLVKANKVADKYMAHEENVQVEVSKNRTQKGSAAASKLSRVIRNSEEFQIALENYPDLKANESIMELLNQIRDSENGFAQAKLNYNAFVECYNTLIHTFPNNMIRGIFKFKDAEFYNDEADTEISDEALGI